MMKKMMVMLALFVFMFTSVCCLAEAEPVSGESTRTSSRFVIDGEEYQEPLYDYELLADGTVRIVKCHEAFRYGAVPESIDGCTVSEIGEHSYSSWNTLGLTLAVPDCVTIIRENAFGDYMGWLKIHVSETHPTLKIENGMLICPAEKRVIRGGYEGEAIIPEGIESIDNHAFSSRSLVNISIPSSVQRIGRNPFAFCNTNLDTYYQLENVELSPDNTALEILDGALFSLADHRLVWCFDRNYDPGPYAVPDGTEIIDDFAFGRWGQIESVYIPASVVKVGMNPFYGAKLPGWIEVDPDNKALICQENMLIQTEEHRLVCGYWILGTFAVPDGIEIIGDYAFGSLNTGLKCGVVLPDSVAAIGIRAFSSAVSPEINIPAGVRQIGDYAFVGCGNLGNQLEFRDKVDIGEGAFTNCTGITGVTARGGAVIGKGAFSYCSDLEEVILEGDCRIRNNAFINCSKLQTTVLAEGLTELGSGAFFGCESLAELRLPESLSFIGEMALYNAKRQEYNEIIDVYIDTYFSTIHVSLTPGSFAEKYCELYEIEYSTD